MPQINDCKFDALRAQGYIGAIDDMERAWGIDNGLPDGTVGTPWYNALTAAGYTGHINDMAFQFWCVDGGTFNLKAIAGWTDGINCDGSGFTSVRFNSQVTFTSHAGVSFHNITTGAQIIAPSSTTVSPASDIHYSLAWAVDPVAGDVIEWRYDGTGTYVDDSAVPLVAGTLTLINCLGPLPPATFWLAEDATPWQAELIAENWETEI